jgi:hypothetical protein
MVPIQRRAIKEPVSEVTMRSTFTIIPLLLSIGCGDDTIFDITGKVDGTAFTADSAYWGGPFVAFVNQPDDCMDYAWVQKSIDENDDPPTDRDLKALLFTYEESDVAEGNNSVEGNAPVDARLIIVQDGALTVHRAQTGFLDLAEITKKDRAIGNFTLGFESGDLTGDFEIDWCNNLKSKY